MRKTTHYSRNWGKPVCNNREDNLRVTTNRSKVNCDICKLLIKKNEEERNKTMQIELKELKEFMKWK